MRMVPRVTLGTSSHSSLTGVPAEEIPAAPYRTGGVHASARGSKGWTLDRDSGPVPGTRTAMSPGPAPAGSVKVSRVPPAALDRPGTITCVWFTVVVGAAWVSQTSLSEGWKPAPCSVTWGPARVALHARLQRASIAVEEPDARDVVRLDAPQVDAAVRRRDAHGRAGDHRVIETQGVPVLVGHHALDVQGVEPLERR